jgi:hypothetical protein
MGDAFTGIVHPCKIYNVLRIGSPVLAIGPAESHIVDVLREVNGRGQARVVRHGDVEAVVKHLVEGAETKTPPCPRPDEFKAVPFSKATLLPRAVELMESVRAETKK